MLKTVFIQNSKFLKIFFLFLLQFKQPLGSESAFDLRSWECGETLDKSKACKKIFDESPLVTTDFIFVFKLDFINLELIMLDCIVFTGRENHSLRKERNIVKKKLLPNGSPFAFGAPEAPSSSVLY